MIIFLGTFDVSIIEIGDGVIEVLATAGDNRLGGDDFDKKISDFIVNDFKNKEGIDISGDKMAMQRIKEAAEKAKKELSAATSTEINLPYLTATADGPKHYESTLTRAKFNELTADLVERTAGPVQRALSDAGIKTSELGKVLLVGGSTRIPAVQDKVKQLTGQEPSKSLNPDECVALGASIQGGKLAGDAGAGEILLLDVTPLSLAIETMGGVATKLIERNTTIPVKKSQVFSTAEDNQTAVDVHVVQGERQFAKDNKTLGMFRLDGIPPARRGTPQIEVTFDIDANGIVNVSAKDLGSGREQHITITSGSNMTDAEIDRAVKEAAEFEKEDKARKEKIDLKNDTEALCNSLEKNLEDLKDNINSSDKEEIEEIIKNSREIIAKDQLSDEDADVLKQNKEKLLDKFQNISENVYKNVNSAASSNQNNYYSNNSDDNSSDDDFSGSYKEL